MCAFASGGTTSSSSCLGRDDNVTACTLTGARTETATRAETGTVTDAETETATGAETEPATDAEVEALIGTAIETVPCCKAIFASVCAKR